MSISTNADFMGPVGEVEVPPEKSVCLNLGVPCKPTLGQAAEQLMWEVTQRREQRQRSSSALGTWSQQLGPSLAGDCREGVEHASSLSLEREEAKLFAHRLLRS